DLDAELRTIFVLREILEIPLAETAAMLERPMQTVSSQHKLAREQFEAALSRHRAKERRTSRGAAAMLLPLGPGTLLQFIRRHPRPDVSPRVQAEVWKRIQGQIRGSGGAPGWLGQPAKMTVSRGGLALAAGAVFTAGAIAGVTASNAIHPAPRPSTHV